MLLFYSNGIEPAEPVGGKERFVQVEMGSDTGEPFGAVGDGSSGPWDLAVVGLDWDHIGGADSCDT